MLRSRDIAKTKFENDETCFILGKSTVHAEHSYFQVAVWGGEGGGMGYIVQIYIFLAPVSAFQFYVCTMGYNVSLSLATVEAYC